ncbi:MAG: nucleotidyltransferase [Lachnospiraceae bacterium]|nr:nucleotidyltransferase [Lachnospiraceae bacterium]
MTVNGIIAEYNPFHNGHRYQMENSRQKTNADYTIVVMSGNFMQRGTPALVDKFKRTEMALRNGADLVLEIPVFYSVGSAEYFATGAVALLDKLGVVTHLCFGAECERLNILQRMADIFVDEPLKYSEYLKEYVRQGNSFPVARAMALIRYAPELSDCRDVLNSSNNILAIEYLKALKKRESLMHPVLTVRRGTDYNDRMLGTFQSSALAIRQAIYDHANMSALASQIPDSAFKILCDVLAKGEPIRLNDFSSVLHYKLISEAKAGYTQYLDVSTELSDRIRNHLCDFVNFSEFCDLLKTKDITYTRVSRCLMHILLDIREDDMAIYLQSDCIKYARVLGFRKESEALLAAIDKASSIPLLTKLADAQKTLNEFSYEMLQKELLISSYYGSTAAVKTGVPMTNEYRSPLVIV